MSPNPKKNIILAGNSVQHSESVRPIHGPAAAPPPSPESTPEYEAGRVHGRDEARKELAAHVQAFMRLANALPAQTQELKRVIDNLVTRLSLKIAARVIEREVKDPETVKGMVARALREAPLIEKLTLRMNPADIALLEEFRGQPLAGNTSLPEEAALVGDKTIARGGCIVENGAGKLDARIETQLGLIARALLGEDGEKHGL